MPQLPVASVPVYGIGAPATLTEVLRFKVRNNQGGKLQLRLSAERADNDLTFSVQVSSDGGTTWNATTADNNLTAITSKAVPARTAYNAPLLLRANVDDTLRILASGSDKGDVEIRGEGHILDIVTI